MYFFVHGFHVCCCCCRCLHGQVAACSWCCSTSTHKDPKIWAWSVLAHACRPAVTCTGWLFLSECSTSLLWQSIVVFGTELQCTSPTTVCQSLKFLVTSICDLPDIISCQFRELAIAPLGPVNFLFLDQQSGIHCLIIYTILLLTLNNLGGPEDVSVRWTF